MPEHEHFTLSELQNTPKKKANYVVTWILDSISTFFFVPTPTPITSASYILLTVSLLIECINSPLSFANKVICLLDPDPTFNYSSFIWVFLLKYMGQVFRAVEQFPFDLFPLINQYTCSSAEESSDLPANWDTWLSLEVYKWLIIDRKFTQAFYNDLLTSTLQNAHMILPSKRHLVEQWYFSGWQS